MNVNAHDAYHLKEKNKSFSNTELIFIFLFVVLGANRGRATRRHEWSGSIEVIPWPHRKPV